MIRSEIVVGKTDHGKLMRLANGLMERNPDLAEELVGELERASVADDAAIPAGTVQMGSTVEYRTGGDPPRRVTLVYPVDADIAQGRISILTPVGTALLGLSVGQTIDFVANDGRQHLMTIVSVEEGSDAAA
ncbi:nucleoside diphosphate kinase regulator [Rhizobium puerariae]|uniref:Nucleoside diphosphate kinase regulator n=1 Tax=Rhizobium puerariae TaxID=1585791 RepID=A0ABV6AF65_9HYPH